MKTEKASIASSRLLQIIDEGLGTTLGIVSCLCDKYKAYDCRSLFTSIGLPFKKEIAQCTTDETLLKLVSHFLVCAGDLARYKAQYNPTFFKHDRYDLANVFYTEAAHCLPTWGHPFNMLAVIATQLEQPLKTIYYYIRSFNCQDPSNMGKDNLMKYLKSGLPEKHAKWNIEPLIGLLLSNSRPGIINTGLDNDMDQFYLFVILIAISVPLTALTDYYAFIQSDSVEGQFIALISAHFGLVQTKTCITDDIRKLTTELKGFIPLEPLITTILSGQDIRQEEEEVIHFRGYQ